MKSDELDGLLKLYGDARESGENHVGAVKVALEAVLVSPHFLYRIELDPAQVRPSVELL